MRELIFGIFFKLISIKRMYSSLTNFYSYKNTEISVA